MSLRRLHTLGEHKFRRIGEQLMRGVPANSIAQLIQHEWGDCLDVERDILIEELESLRSDLSTSSHAPKRWASQGNGGMHRLNRPGHGCLDELVELGNTALTAETQTNRGSCCNISRFPSGRLQPPSSPLNEMAWRPTLAGRSVREAEREMGSLPLCRKDIADRSGCRRRKFDDSLLRTQPRQPYDHHAVYILPRSSARRGSKLSQ